MTYDTAGYTAEQWAAAAAQADQEAEATKKELAAAQARLAELETAPELTPQQAEEQIKAIPQYVKGEGGRMVPNPEYKAKYVELLRKAGVQVMPDRRGRW
jgi:4-aminobutyrate aminotransferase-like enzyme